MMYVYVRCINSITESGGNQKKAFRAPCEGDAE